MFVLLITIDLLLENFLQTLRSPQTSSNLLRCSASVSSILGGRDFLMTVDETGDPSLHNWSHYWIQNWSGTPPPPPHPTPPPPPPLCALLKTFSVISFPLVHFAKFSSFRRQLREMKSADVPKGVRWKNQQDSITVLIRRLLVYELDAYQDPL